MRHPIRTAALAAACLVSFAAAADTLVRFEGGIGSQPLRAGALPNDANGVPPGGRPWVISSLDADIATDGRIKVEGRGLLLAGGAVATNGGQTVKAQLFCDGAAHLSEQQAALDANGDFRIEGFLTPTPPAVCARASLLIVNVPQGVWFAAGIPKR